RMARSRGGGIGHGGCDGGVAGAGAVVRRGWPAVHLSAQPVLHRRQQGRAPEPADGADTPLHPLPCDGRLPGPRPWLLPHAPRRTLDIYFIDVEGGAATLIVSPMGESILVDSGWRRDDDRDARRIHHVATQVAGLSRIDYAVTTHWHMDHYGGIGRLAEMIP